MIAPRFPVAPAAALFAALAAAGCIPSAESEIASYREVLDPGGSGAETELPSPTHPLELRDALLLAVRNNERLAVAGEDYLQALIDKDRQYAGFLPAISFGVRHFRQPDFSLGDSAGGGSSLSSFSPTDSTDLPFTFSMNIFNGFRDYNGVRRAFATVRNREGLLKNLKADVLLETAQVYYQALRAEAAVRVLEDNRALQESRLRDIRERLREGVARPLDVAQSEADLAEVKVLLVGARRDVRNARTTLAFLVGLPEAPNPLADGVTVPDDPETDDDLVARALRSRDDIRAAEARVQEREREVLVAWGAFLPVGAIDLNLYALKQTFPRDIAWDLLLRAAQPLYSAGLLEADVRQAYSRLRQAEFSLENLRRQVRQEVTNAASDLRTSRDRLVELEAARRSALEAYRLSSERYKEGFATNLDVQTAQNQRLLAEVRLETERLDFKALYLRLLRLTADFPAQPLGLPQ